MPYRFTLAVLVACLAGALAWGASAQEPASETAAAAHAAESSPLDTPEGAVRHFLEAMNAVANGQTGRADDALATLHIPEEEAPRAPMLAQRLWETLDATTLDLGAIRVDGRTARLPLGQGESLTLHRYDDGRWRFNTATVERIDDLHEDFTAPGANGAAEAAPEGVEPGLASPRETMRTFIEAMNRYAETGKDAALERAVATFEKEGLDAVNLQETAQLLKRILDRWPPVIYQEIPNYAEGPPHSQLAPRHPDAVVIARDPASGEWRFTAETLEDLWDFWKDVAQYRPVMAGHADESQLPLSLRIKAWMATNAPALMKRTVLLQNWQWLGLFAVILAGMLLSRIISGAVLSAVRQWFRRRAYGERLEHGRQFVRPIRVALMAWAWWLGLQFLGLPEDTQRLLTVAAQTVSAAAIVWAAYRMVDILGQYLEARAARTVSKFDDLLAPLLTRTLKVFVVVFGVVFVAETLRIDYKSLLAGVGIGGLAFALAAKDTVGNFFGSITVLMDRPFQIGDWVKIGDHEGIVENMGMRSTRIRTFYNSLITLPNSELITARIDNLGKRQYRRISCKLALTYDTPPEKIEAFCEGVRELIRTHPYTRKDYYQVYLNEFASDSLGILLYCFHETPDWNTELRERHRLFLDIIRLAKRVGVEFAFPTQTLYVRQEDTPDALAGNPDGAGQAKRFGRNEAREIAKAGLGGLDAPKPPPVTFDVVPEEADERPSAGSADDGG